jgi:hypothetical protein
MNWPILSGNIINHFAGTPGDKSLTFFGPTVKHHLPNNSQHRTTLDTILEVL